MAIEEHLSAIDAEVTVLEQLRKQKPSAFAATASPSTRRAKRTTPSEANVRVGDLAARLESLAARCRKVEA